MNRSEHLLSCLAEECAEVAQRVSKALRFGLAEIQPGQPLTNGQRINEELRDLFSVVIKLDAEGILPNELPSPAEARAKTEKIERFMVYAGEQGALQLCSNPREEALTMAGIDWSTIPNRETDDAHPINVLAGVHLCATHWSPQARIVGNVRAGDIVRAIDWLATQPSGTSGELAAAPTCSDAEAVAVKPLAWTQSPPPGHDHEPFVYWAAGLGGHYRAEPDGTLWMSHDAFVWEKHASQKDAKAAAQTDHEQRVRSLASPTPSASNLQNMQSAFREPKEQA